LLSAWAGTFAEATANEQEAPEAGIHVITLESGASLRAKQ